jgi:hypothetical protein
MSAGDSTSAPRRQPHPAPHRARVGRWTTWFSILGAPLAWSLQLLINASLSAHGCYPHDVPLAVPLWGHLDAAAAGVEAVAAAVCFAAGFAAWLNWRRSRGEKAGNAHHLVESGDGRTRFMAMVGMMTSALFLIATGFAALNLTTVPACGG